MAGPHDDGFFTAKDGLRLYWQSDLPASGTAPRAHVAMIHGYGDHSGRYGGLRAALVAAGFAAHGFDYRGHGRADGQRGHVERFAQYHDDVGRFWERVRAGAGGAPVYLYGHSLGGLLALQFALRKPEGLRALILASPFVGFAFTPPAAKVFGAKLVGAFWPSAPFSSGLKIHELTRDPALQEATRRDPLYHEAVTPRWFDEVRKAQANALATAPQLTVPTFVFIGGNDPIASVPATRQLFERVGSVDKKYKEYPGMLHETFNEVGRDEVERDVSNWISQHA